jgi:hypothetical protein
MIVKEKCEELNEFNSEIFRLCLLLVGTTVINKQTRIEDDNLELFTESRLSYSAHILVMSPLTAPYGTWNSLITAEAISKGV